MNDERFSRRDLLKYCGAGMLIWGGAADRGSAMLEGEPSEVDPAMMIDDFVFGTPVVNVQIGNEVHKFFFDTGAGESVDASLARQLGWTADSRVNVITAYENVVSAGRKSGVTLRADNVVLRDGNVIILDQLLSSDPDLPHGTIGLGFLQAFVTTIDAEGRRIVCQDVKGYVPPPNSTALEMDLSEEGLIIKAAIDGVAGDFVFDTGALGLVSLREHYWRQGEFLSHHRHSTPIVMEDELAGQAETYYCRGGSLDIGAWRLPKPFIIMNGNSAQFTRGKNIAGSINSSILKYFIVTFDCRGKRLILQRNSRKIQEDNFSSSGITLNFVDGRAFVWRIVPESPANQFGIHIGDEVIGIDEVAMTATSRRQIEDALWHKPIGGKNKIHLRGPDGDRTVSLNLHDWI